MAFCQLPGCLEQPEFSWLKAEPNNEFEAQCTLCRTTLNLGTRESAAIRGVTILQIIEAMAVFLSTV